MTSLAGIDPAGPHAHLLDCYDDNLQVLARHAGAADAFTPFARDWGFRAPDPAREPEFAREPVHRRLRQDTGLALTWHPAAARDELLAAGRPIFAVGDAFAMPWLPYHGHAHMDHSFIVDAIGGGTAHIADAYHNDTAWGPARPTRTAIGADLLERLLGAGGRVATLEPGGPPAPPGPAAVMAANGRALDVAALRGYGAALREALDDEPATRALALACWLGLRSRTRHGLWLDSLAGRVPAAAPVAARFRDAVVPAWRRAGEQAYIAQQRAARGRRIPGGAFDTGPVADAEAAAAHDSNPRGDAQ